MQYPVNEIFQTIQCEGHHTGEPAIFIRMQGCDVGCSWCDTKNTWQLKNNYQTTIKNIIDKEESKAYHWSYADANLIKQIIIEQKWQAKLAVITGGEPCMHDLVPLCKMLEGINIQPQIETSGTYEINATDSTWVCLSPKLNANAKKTILSSAIVRADEIKYPVAEQQDIVNLKTILDSAELLKSKKKIVYLQPISKNKYATKIAIANCLNENWKLSVQTHKYINIK